jgi:hypothetical protein
VNTSKLKNLLLPIGLLSLLSGCAMTRPHVLEMVTSTNGVVTRREIWLPAFVIWPGTQVIEKQRGSIGKTISAGVVAAEQDSGGTNVVDALKYIDSILGKIR